MARKQIQGYLRRELRVLLNDEHEMPDGRRKEWLTVLMSQPEWPTAAKTDPGASA
jgi:hypothetical protein